MSLTKSRAENRKSKIENPLVSVVVVAWNRKEDTLACVESLRRSDYPGLDIVVVDNGSSDGTVRALETEFPAVGRLDAGGNRGYAGGNNLGMREAFARGADFAFLVNNDTTLEPDCIRHLVEAAHSDPEIAFAAPSIYYHASPKEPWFVGSTLDLESGLALHENGTLPTREVDLPWATGCAMFVSRAAFEKTGGFDERFFFYCEDVDWSIRLRQAGYRIVLVPDARVYHKVARTIGALSPRAIYYGARNNLMLVSKHTPSPQRGRALRRVAWRHLREAIRLAKNRPRQAFRLPVYALRGIVDFYRGRFGPL